MQREGGEGLDLLLRILVSLAHTGRLAVESELGLDEVILGSVNRAEEGADVRIVEVGRFGRAVIGDLGRTLVLELLKGLCRLVAVHLANFFVIRVDKVNKCLFVLRSSVSHVELRNQE